MTAFCCRSSGQLELNHSGTKVRRKDQLPHIDLPTTSIKTILAKVPTEETNMTVDEVTYMIYKILVRKKLIMLTLVS